MSHKFAEHRNYRSRPGDAAFQRARERNAEREREDREAKEKKYQEYLCKYTEDQDINDRVTGFVMRGEDFPVSKDGNCPRCGHEFNTFVILDLMPPPFSAVEDAV